MFEVNGHLILTDELEVLKELQNQCLMNGKQLFRKFIKTNSNIQFCCPIHNNGAEKKPSCGITIVPKKNIRVGTVHCFSCGYSASLEEMISNVFDKDDMGKFGTKWLIKNFLVMSIEERKDIKLDMSRKQIKEEIKYITEEELDSYRYIHPYMYKRKLTDFVIDKFDIGYDKNTKSITFPTRDINGNVLFIVKRSVNSKFFSYPEDVEKPVFGIYEVPKDEDTLIICESRINALTIWGWKYDDSITSELQCQVCHAVALDGTGTPYQYQQLLKMTNIRKLITAFDPDKAGRKGTERLKKAMSGKKIITSLIIPPNKDVNDLEFEQFLNLPEIF